MWSLKFWCWYEPGWVACMWLSCSLSTSVFLDHLWEKTGTVFFLNVSSNVNLLNLAASRRQLSSFYELIVPLLSFLGWNEDGCVSLTAAEPAVHQTLPPLFLSGNYVLRQSQEMPGYWYEAGMTQSSLQEEKWSVKLPSELIWSY